MKKLVLVAAVLLVQACDNSAPPKAPEGAAPAADAGPAVDAGKMVPDKK